MQLWKKNFLVIYGIFLAVVCGGLLLLDSYISQNEIRQWIGQARNSERSIYYLAAGLKNEEVSRMSMNLNDAARRYEEAGILTRVRVNEYIAADYFPEGEGKDAGSVGSLIEVRRIRGERYLFIQEVGREDGVEIAIEYAQELEAYLSFRQGECGSFAGQAWHSRGSWDSFYIIPCAGSTAR